MSKHNNNNNDNKKIVETTANENNEVNLDELLDQYDEEPTAEAAEETNVNETQEENNMDNNNTQVQAQNTQAQETSKKEKVINVFKGIGKYGSIVVAAGAAGWFGHKYLSKDTSAEPTAEQAFL